MTSIEKVAFIGAGNVAWHLAPALENVGIRVHYVYSRDSRNAASLVKRLYQGEVLESLDLSDIEVDLVIIAVKDEAIEEIATELVLPDGSAAVHTSGTQPLSLLGYLATDNIGVFYPLQTFTKERKVDFSHVPICLEANTEPLMSKLEEIGNLLSNRVLHMDSNDRKVFHLAAVFACNFTNHLLQIAQSILNNKGMDFDLLFPLIRETIEKAMKIGPQAAQTGPAIRGDMEVLESHLSLLGADEKKQKIYQILSESIASSGINGLQTTKEN